MKFTIFLASLLFPVFGFAQSYSINWYKVSGGGGNCTNSQYSLTATIGQPDAGGPMTGGNYSLTGGFWALYAVQSPGTPSLTITYSANQAIVSWPSLVAGWTLQTNANLSPSGWVNYAGAVGDNGTVKSVTNKPPRGNLYFRLTHP
jgi:hypothetical protein